jgi:hypothetical protein
MKKLFLLLLLPGISFGQLKTNLEVMYSLLDSAASEVTESDGIKTYSFEAGSTNRLFYNRFIAEMSSRNLVMMESGSPDLQFVIESTSVKYGDMFRKGFLGSFYIPRTINLNGNYLILEGNRFKEFNLVYSDSIEVDNITEVENEFYPFTKGVVPPEPFFSSIIEPVIAIGTTAAAVILFFTVRSR